MATSAPQPKAAEARGDERVVFSKTIGTPPAPGSGRKELVLSARIPLWAWDPGLLVIVAIILAVFV